MSTYLNLEMVAKFVEQILRNKPVGKLMDEPTIVTYGNTRRPGCSDGESCQNITMGWKTRPFVTHRQWVKIPFNHNDCNQLRWQTGKTCRHWSKHRWKNKQLWTHQNFEGTRWKNQEFTTPGGDGRAAQRKKHWGCGWGVPRWNKKDYVGYSGETAKSLLTHL